VEDRLTHISIASNRTMFNKVIVGSKSVAVVEV
jgi:hypothetical protein